MGAHPSAPAKGQRLYALGVLLVLLLVSGMEAYYLWRLRNAAIDNHLEQTFQQATAFEEHLTQTMSVVDFTLINIAEKDADTHALTELLRNARYVRSFSLLDSQGVVLRSSEPRNLGQSLNVKTFLPQADGPINVLRVGPLMRGRDLHDGAPIAAGAPAPDQFYFAVQRDITTDRGAVLRAVAVINPDYFLNYYGRQMNADVGWVELLRIDGSLLLSTAERFVPASLTRPVLLERWKTAEFGRVAHAQANGEQTLTGYRLSRFFPAAVQVHVEQEKVLDAWRREAITTVLVTALLLLLMVGTTVLYFFRTMRLARERESWIKALDDQKYALDQHAIVSVTDARGVITYANDRFCEISGYRRDELLGQSHRIVNSGQHDADFFPAMWRTIASGQVWHGEVCNRKKNGDLYWVSATIVPLKGPDGRIAQYIGIRTDLTDRKQIELSLEEARVEAERASVAKSQFLANMSHEIRTPMNAVLGLLQLLRRTDLTTIQRDYAVKSEQAARSLLSLLNDILDFSKVEAGKMTLETEPFRLDQLLRNLSVVLSASAEDRDVEVLYAVDPDLPPVVAGDALRLQQILVNLGGNAIKFTSKGQVVVSLQVQQRSSDAVRLRFAVQDTGIGIAPEHLDHIFTGFSQAEASTTRRFGGTGLGLAICKRFVEMMGGALEVQSTVGIGSTFHFTIRLPLVSQPPAELVQEPRAVLPARRVLVVDDNPVAAELLASMVRSWGWSVDLAHSGREALERVRAALEQRRAEAGSAFPYPAVLVDWHMPRMDGWEVAQQLRALASGAACEQPQIIMVTAHGREMLAHRSEQEQSLLNGFLVKPVTASMVYDALADAGEGQQRLRKSVRRSSQRRLAGMRILVVEDNLINQQVAEELLNAEGALVSMAANGQLGVDAVRAAAPQFDVVLMDIQMPILDGYGATAKIRDELGLKTLPIVAMTANAMASDRLACLNAGMNEHVGKPFDMNRLVALLLQVTGLTPASSHSTHSTDPTNSIHATATGTEPPSDAADAASSAASAATGPRAIDGLELHTALARMSGMQALYVRTAREFVRSMPTLQQDLLHCISQGNVATGVMRLHTLKGNAATLGASELAGLAARLETQCRAEQSLQACQQHLDALTQTLDDTRGLLERAVEQLSAPAAVAPAQTGTQAVKQAGSQAILAAPPASAVSAKAEVNSTAEVPPNHLFSPALREAVQALAQQLAADDMDALMTFATLRADLDLAPAPSDLMDALDSALQDLELAQAHQVCLQLLARLG